MIAELERQMRERRDRHVWHGGFNRNLLPERFQRHAVFHHAGRASFSDHVMDEVNTGPTHRYFHHYRTVNAFLDMCALKCIVYSTEGRLSPRVPSPRRSRRVMTALREIFRTRRRRIWRGWASSENPRCSYRRTLGRACGSPRCLRTCRLKAAR